MSDSAPDMMAVRRSALDQMADLAPPEDDRRPFSDFRVDLGDHPPGDGPDDLPAKLVEAITERLVRDNPAGQGAVLLTGLSARFELPAARRFHETLFDAVWAAVRPRSLPPDPGAAYRTKTNVTADGAIPLELYGSRWSFKQLHMDRDALLFSHLYGPVTGFTGGGLLLADMQAYMRRHALRFADLFDWSQESTPGSKPVLREEHREQVMAECGVEVSGIGPDEILFVNNLPSAGILHGVTPVEVQDPSGFVREFHRCSVRREVAADRAERADGQPR